MKRTKEEAKTTYDRLSRWYDFFAGSSEKKFRQAGLQLLNAGEGEKVLEVGFGTGHCISAIAGAVGDTGKVFGLDISTGMLGITTSRIEKERLSERVELLAGDAVNLPYH